ncbi:MAG: NADH-quinone oxidoreductase subunit L [Acidobacteria bacterium RIFCSPLOWO2_12_FULL_66_21]|nr:MAG: NADH-quinone oxidoreductase subunit L [Acidobacteria bacterium RIFCSPLOWO2_12_FULL_66_21]
MLVLIPLLPFAGFVINAFVGRRLSKTVSGGLACLVMVAAFLVAAITGWTVISGGHAIEQTLFTWLPSGDLQIPFALRVDPLATVMILVVTGIGALIHVYSIGYMHEETDGEYARYFSYLNLFASFMLVLVLGANFPVMFIGWEGVGLCSYLLIGFWFRKKPAADAGKKAFVVNRIGDFGFILGMLLLFASFHTLDFQGVALAAAARAPETATFGLMTAATLLLFLGATGKSAQIPLYVWLPDAMEGPTPVSALIHAATMVTAGVYMIARNAVLFSHAPTTLAVVAGIGVATALMAGTIGLVQNDIKRVLAYSTVSQLGYMFLAMGMGAYAAGIFHLYTHAFFKALLFLGSGAVIHALAGEQDLRNMGGLKKALPVTYWTFLTGAIAIAGVPPLSGFFSKDEILFRTFTGTAVNGWNGRPLLWLIGIVTSLLTATYMFRLVFMAFHGERRHDAPAAPVRPEEEEPGAPVPPLPGPVYSDLPAVDRTHGATHASHAHEGAHLHDAPPSMAIPLIVLAIGSIVAGFIGVPHAIWGSNRIETFLDPSFEVSREAAATEPGAPLVDVPPAAEPHEDTGRELTLMAVSTGIAFAGIGIAMYFWLRNRAASDRMARRFAALHRLLLNKYYVDEIYDAAVVQPIRLLSTSGLWKGVDVGIIDGAVNGVGLSVGAGSRGLRRAQTGSVRTYAASLFLGVVLILGWYLWR